MIEIKEVSTPKQLKEFIYLPEKIHRNHQNWLYPLYMDEEVFFNREKNAMFKHNQAILFLAYRNGECVGRIMGVIPDEYNEKQGVKSGRFSYFECYEDKAIFLALLGKIEAWAKEKGCNELIGPMGFSDKEPQGFLTKGFHENTMYITNCNFEFMTEFIKEQNYQPYVELCQYEVPITQEILSKYQRFTQRVERTLDIKIHEFKSSSKVRPFVPGVFDLINESYQQIYGFTSVTEKEMEEFANRFLPILDPKLIKIITKEEKVVAFIVAMPDISEGLRKAKGRLFPLGWWHILRNMKKTEKLMLLLGGISPTMQNKGLDAVLATSLFKSALKNQRFKVMDSHLIMKENTKMRGEIEKLEGHKMYKEYAIFRKEI